MNYRHAYHAGGFADVLKHAVLALSIEHLKRKEKGCFLLDAHAGPGRYDLAGPEAVKTGEYRHGIARLLAEPAPPAELAPYLAAVRGLNGGGDGRLRWYPGSPCLLRRLMRPQDRLHVNELHAADAEALAATFANDPQVTVHRRDGYALPKALLPPVERRGLVLIDPAFEATDEEARLVGGLVRAHRRWATGIYVLWFPIKDRAGVEALYRAVERTGIRGILRVELLVWPEDNRFRLNGSGLLVVNPPWTLPAQLGRVLPFLQRVLARDGRGGSRADWLVGE